MDLLFESFLQAFLPLILLMPYLFLLYFWYGKFIVINKYPEIEVKDGEEEKGFAILEKIAFVAYGLILLQAIFDGRIIKVFFVDSMFIERKVNPTTFWLNFAFYGVYMLIIILKIKFRKSNKNS